MNSSNFGHSFDNLPITNRNSCISCYCFDTNLTSLKTMNMHEAKLNLTKWHYHKNTYDFDSRNYVLIIPTVTNTCESAWTPCWKEKKNRRKELILYEAARWSFSLSTHSTIYIDSIFVGISFIAFRKRDLYQKKQKIDLHRGSSIA